MQIYIEAFSGLSGDMFLGALAGLTGSYDELKTYPKLFGLQEAKVEVTEVNKNGIVCKHVQVVNMHDDQNPHRYLSDIFKIIENSEVSASAKKIAKDIFLIIGRSESKIHNIPLEKIHFHEVSGVDSIIDILGCAVLIDKMQISKTFALPVCIGSGFVKTQHGVLPVPAPATADILLGIPTYPGEEKGEKVTPTGAAILKFLNPDFDVPVLRTKQIAYGPGKKNFTSPNVLRISVCEEDVKRNQLFVLETNIDDMPGEFLGRSFQDNLTENGAVDFYLTPVQMKKSRMGFLLSCIVLQKDLKTLSDHILKHTTSIGVRYYPVERNILKREIRKVKTGYGVVNVKTVTDPDGKERVKIEYEDLLKLSKELKLPLQELQNEILRMINQEI